MKVWSANQQQHNIQSTESLNCSLLQKSYSLDTLQLCLLYRLHPSLTSALLVKGDYLAALVYCHSYISDNCLLLHNTIILSKNNDETTLIF